MAVIGNGAQSEFQAIAFHHLLGIEQVRLFDVDPAATEKLVANLALSAPALRAPSSASFPIFECGTALAGPYRQMSSVSWVCSRSSPRRIAPAAGSVRVR